MSSKVYIDVIFTMFQRTQSKIHVFDFYRWWQFSWQYQVGSNLSLSESKKVDAVGYTGK